MIPSIKNYSINTRKVYTLFVPSLGDIVQIDPNTSETAVGFGGDLTNDFTINVTPGPRAKLGDKIYIFLAGDGTTVTFTGNVIPTQCGDTENTYEIADPICLEVVFNGINYIGIDNC